MAEMKLYYENYRQTYSEFLALSELTTLILQSMGIILKGLNTDRHTSGMQASRFTEFSEDDEEQQMEIDGVYSSMNKGDILTMQNLDDSSNIVPNLTTSQRSGRAQGTPFESQCQEPMGNTQGKHLKEAS